MGYKYSEQTGEKYPNENYETDEDWCPYYNLEGKYVGTRYGLDYYTGNPEYFNSLTREVVKNYEDLDW